MITTDKILSIPKENLPEAAKALEPDDLPQLVEWLALKDDDIRYRAFLLLQGRSMFFEDVYPFWDDFSKKLGSDNSYQRSIGLMLIAENARWDTKKRMEEIIDEYLTLLTDEKPITIRQCIQSLGKIAKCKPDLHRKITDCLISLDLTAIKETMRKSILLDITNVLLIIRKEWKADEAENYIVKALTGEILDKKSKKQIETEMQNER